MEIAADGELQIGSVRAAVNMFGERIVGRVTERKNGEMLVSEMTALKERELHLAKNDISRYKDAKNASETMRIQAGSELLRAKMATKDLALQIKKSRDNAKSQKLRIHGLSTHENSSTLWETGASNAKNQYMEVSRELEGIKEEVRKIKSDMASALETKRIAEKQAQESTEKARAYSSSLHTLRKEIDNANEEHVLVKLASIEALKEFHSIEAQREANASQYSSAMEKTQKKIKDLAQQINSSKELQMTLAVTLADSYVLEQELQLVKAMDLNSDAKKRSSDSSTGKEKEDEVAAPSTQLQAIMSELEAAKKDLESIRQEGFQFMTSMDTIRDELRRVSKELAELKSEEEREDANVQFLNSELLKAKAMLESAEAAEKKVNTILSDLSTSLRQLRSEADAAKKRREKICKEIQSLRLEIENTEADISITEQNLESAMQELEAVKAAEAIALDNLRTLSEKTRKDRASSSQQASSITISNFEFQYLNKKADGADEIADKKVAAAQAWVNAIKAGEKEILLKIEMAQREIRELSLSEERERHETEKSLTAKKQVEGELNKFRKKEKQTELISLQPEPKFLSKPVGDYCVYSPSRTTKLRTARSPGKPHFNHTSFTMKKKKRAIPNLPRLFSNKKSAKTF
ncbi:hypothetical protein AMTRI_Chr12g235010 [Amborella trichopoda]